MIKSFTIACLLSLITLSITAQDFSWAKRAGGSSDNDATSTTTDAAGNIYVTGYFKSTAFFGEGSNQVSITSTGGADMFFAKYNSAGELIWVKQAGGSQGFEFGNAIELDSEENIILIGFFDEEATFGEGSSAITITSSGNSRDIFICKYNNSGEILWAQSAGGIYLDNGSGITIDSEDNIFAVGSFRGEATFGMPGNYITITAEGGGEKQDSYIAKYNANGDLSWVNSYSFDAEKDGLSNIKMDDIGNLFVSGSAVTGSTSYYDPVVAKLDNSGNILWLDIPTGVSTDYFTGLVVDQEGNCILVGTFQNDLIIGDITILTGNESSLANAFYAKYSASGDVIWAKAALGTGGATPYGGELGDGGKDIAIDQYGFIYVTGYICGTTTFGNDCHTADIISEGYKDIFVAKLNGDADLQWVINTGGTNAQEPNGIAINGENIILAGGYTTSANIGGTYLGGLGGFTDIFVANILNQTTKANYAKELSAEITNWNINASDITVNFNKAPIEETVSEYRIFITKTENAEDFNLEEANFNTNYSVITPDETPVYSVNPDENSKDSDGDDISEGVSYVIFVLSVADGTIATTNALSCVSNSISITQTDISENNAQNISIYPNPSNGSFVIKSDAIQEITITDITGKIIYQQKEINNNSFSATSIKVDLPTVAKGIYLVKVKKENRNYTKKINVQ